MTCSKESLSKVAHVVRRVLVGTLVTSTLLICGVNVVNGATTVDASSAYRMCSSLKTSVRCIEEVKVYDATLSDVRDQFVSSPGAPFVQIPGSTDSATCRTCRYTDLLQIRVVEAGGVSIDVWGVAVGRYANDPNHPAYVYSSPIVDIDLALKIDLRVNLGKLNVSTAYSQSYVDEYQVTKNKNGDVVVSMRLRPAELSHFNATPGVDPLAECRAPGAKASHTASSIHLEIVAEVAWSDEARPGFLVSNNYGCIEKPNIGWEQNTEQWRKLPLKSRGKPPAPTFAIRTSAPHLRADGTQNVGHFSAVLPPNFLMELGISTDEFLKNSIELTLSDEQNNSVPVPIEVSLNPNGFVILRATQDFHYSAPTLRLSRSTHLKSGASTIKISSNIGKVRRGQRPVGQLQFPGVKTGKAYVYLKEKSGFLTLVQAVSIRNGIAKLTSRIPTTASTGKASIIVSYFGRDKSIRSTLTHGIVID